MVHHLFHFLTGLTLTSLNLSLVSSSIFKKMMMVMPTTWNHKVTYVKHVTVSGTAFEKGRSNFYFIVNFKALNVREQLMSQ